MGKCYGLTEQRNPAKTVLTFMVLSICSNYKDVVCLVPVEKIDTKLFEYYFNLGMKAVDHVFDVVAMSVDNHICNR